jgi:hypothetical protein
MSLRTFFRASLFAAAVAAVAGSAGSAAAQTPIPFPIPGTGTPSPIPIPGGTGTPSPIPFPIPGAGGGTPGAPPIPGLPPFPQPGGTVGIPGIPGLPSSVKLFSPTGALLMPAMQDEAKKLFQKLKDALPDKKKEVVASIPLQTDPAKDEINAFAGCDDSGKTFVVVTAGLYQMLDLMAQTRATDEIFGTSTYDAYIRELAAQQEGKAQVLPFPPGLLIPSQSLDSRKLKRQREIFDEAIGYVIGHELGHHYLGHLGSACGGGGGGTFKPGDVTNVLKKVAPFFNQPNEIAADMAGIENLLDMGQNEADYKFGEHGGLLVIDFFQKLADLHPGSDLFVFMSTHPSPKVRAPIVKSTADWWRLRHPGAKTGNGNSTDPTPGVVLPKFPFPIPGAPK